MDLLIVGGTRFLGRHLAAQALAAGHRVTLLNRGQSGPALFPAARHLIADRNGDLLALADGRWDAVIDTCAYVPRHVSTMARALRGRVGHYQLVSTISVYSDTPQHGLTEDAPTVQLDGPNVEAVTGETYGGLKALCERALLNAMPDRAGIVRPGLIVGPHDPTERFTWWVRRLLRGGDVLAPGPEAAPVQFIDVRDLAAFMLAQAEAARTGTVHVSGPLKPMTMHSFLDAAREVLNPAARLQWRAADVLLAQGVQPWTELPLWLPDPSSMGMMSIDLGRAHARGLVCRPLAQTLRDTAAWAASADGLEVESRDANKAVGMAAERERALLA